MEYAGNKSPEKMSLEKRPPKKHSLLKKMSGKSTEKS